MESVAFDWSVVTDNLCHGTDASRHDAGIAPRDLATFQGKVDNYFFHIRYEPGEIIMQQGSYGSFAALLLDGAVAVARSAAGRRAAPLSALARPAECRNRPGWLLHRVENWVLDRTDRLSRDAADAPTNRAVQAGHWLARRMRVVLQGLENWADRATNPSRPRSWWRRVQGRIARVLFHWALRRPRERLLAGPLDQGAAGAAGEPLAPVQARDAGGLRPALGRLLGVSSAL